MTKHEALQLFEDKKVRTLWDSEQEKWFFSIVDIIKILTETPNARKYWSVLKMRLKKEGSQLTTNCSQLKMQSADGKYHKTGKKVVSELNAKTALEQKNKTLKE